MLTQEQQIFEQIKKANSILITFRKTWNGDSVASGLAMFLFLKKLGKEVNIAAEKFDSGKLFSFLPAYNEIKNSIDNLRKFIISLDITNTKVDQIKYKIEDNTLNFIISPKDGLFTEDDISSRSSGFKYDLIIALDTADLESLGQVYDNDTEFFYKTPIINIDHHSENEEFGQINFIELTAVATGEILFSLFESYSRDLIDEDIATCLLAGMISKTRSFKTPNVTPKALLTASQLISMGARREEIVNHLYRSRPINVLKLWGRVLARLSSSQDGKLVWSTLTNMDFTKTDSCEKDLDDVIDELIINIPQAKIVVIIYEKTVTEAAEPITNILTYSAKNINSLDLIKEYNPQGTKDLALASINKPIQETEKEILKLIEEKLSKLPI
jgi:phosphoesterase RecJ-like protein